MKRIFLFILISICCTNTSYQGLLFPINTFEVLTNNSDYHIFKNMILSKSKYNSFSSSYISFPNDISSNTLIYDYKITNLRMKSGIQIINFGNIEDSETGYSFSSQDYIFSHQFSKKIYHQLYSSVEINYLYSKIDNFIGMLSYPIYVGHMIVIHFLPTFDQIYPNGSFKTTLICYLYAILFAIILYFLIERPADYFRHKLIHKENISN